MDSNKRLFIAFSITMILIVAILTSFGGNLFSSTTPVVTLPSVNNTGEDTNQTLSEAPLQRVEIQVETVQTVIASLVVRDNYHRTLTTRLYWGESSQDSAQTTVEVWTDSLTTKVQKTLASGAIRYDIIHQDRVYYWYNKQKTYLTTSAQDYAQDLSQFIPSYQTVLDLDTEWIREADYRLRQNTPCIYVEAVVPPLDFVERYWVHAETGLLLAAETYENGQIIYSMEGFEPISAYDAPSFLLPDGTELS